MTKRDSKKYLPKAELIFDNIKLSDLDKKSAKVFGILKANIQKSGNIVADMNLMIASIAIANNEILISNNIKHFKKIEMLKLEN